MVPQAARTRSAAGVAARRSAWWVLMSAPVPSVVPVPVPPAAAVPVAIPVVPPPVGVALPRAVAPPLAAVAAVPVRPVPVPAVAVAVEAEGGVHVGVQPDAPAGRQRERRDEAGGEEQDAAEVELRHGGRNAPGGAAVSALLQGAQRASSSLVLRTAVRSACVELA